MGTTLQGTIHGRHIELDRDAGMPDGSRVKLRLEPMRVMSDAERLQRLLTLFREMGEDERLVNALDEVVRQRSVPREVDLNAAP